MRDIVPRPEGPLAGFGRGAAAAFIAIGLPLMIYALFMPGGNFWRKLEIGGGMAAACSLVAGVGMAIWRLLQAWAYKEISGDR